VQTGDIKAAQLYLNSFSQTYSEAGLSQSKKWPAGTLCITIAANIAETAILGIDACFPDSVIGFIADENEADVRFVKYKLDFVKQTFQRVSQGAAQDNLSQEKLLSIPLLVPPVAEQRDIADILSSYDDLIENNRRRMELLEASARHLYEEWFVRLRFPGYEHTKIVNGVPEAWEKVQVGVVASITHGYAFKGEFFSDSPTSRVLVTPGNFDLGGGIKLDKCKYYAEDGPLDSRFVLSPLEVVVTMTDLSKQSDTLGFPALIPELEGTQFLHNQRIGRVTPIREPFAKYLLYCTFCSNEYRQHVVGAATGTSVKHTSPSRISSYPFLLPPFESCLKEFENYSELIFNQINKLYQANVRLKQARDLLLPRLMSGEVAV